MRRGSSASSTRVAKSCLGTSGCSHQAVCPASFILFLLQSLLQQQQLINKGKVIYLLQAITSCFIFSFLWKTQENQNTFYGKHQILRLSWALPSNISTAFDHLSIHNTRNITKRMNLFEIQKAFQVCLKVLIFTFLISLCFICSFRAHYYLTLYLQATYFPHSILALLTTQMSITGLRHMSRVTCHESPLVWRCAVLLLRVVACCCGWALPSRWGGCCEMQQ